MRVVTKNAFVNLHTGERFDRISGEGESILVPQQSSLTVEQLCALREYERVMKEETIPEIERVMRQRARDAQWSSQQFI